MRGKACVAGTEGECRGDLNNENKVRKHNLDIKYKPLIHILLCLPKQEGDHERKRESKARSTSGIVDFNLNSALDNNFAISLNLRWKCYKNG